ncbi:hypothetical protein [Sorangium sp. So ce887]
MDTSLAGKVAIVTGASWGIGLSVAQKPCAARAQHIEKQRSGL